MRNENLVIKEIYLSGIVIECEESNQIKPLLTMFHNAGYKWKDNDSYIPICHSPNRDNRFYNVSTGKFGDEFTNVITYRFKDLQEYIDGAVNTQLERDIIQLGNKCTHTSKYDKYTDRELLIKLLEKFDITEEIR